MRKFAPIIPVLAIAGSIAVWSRAASPGLDHWSVDSLIKVFPEDPADMNKASGAPILVARNAHGSIQVALRSPEAISGLRVAVDPPSNGSSRLEAEAHHVGYVRVRGNTKDSPAKELVRKAPGYFPDPLLRDSSFDLKPGRTEAVWITVYAPAGAAPGNYTGAARLLAGESELGKEVFTVRVSAAQVPAEQTLKVTNWFDLEPESVARFYPTAKNPENYWRVVENLGRVMAAHRQNVILTPVFSLTDTAVEGDKIRYSFPRLDRWVETFQRSGLIGTIEGGHLLSRMSGYFTALAVPSYVIEDGAVVSKKLPPSDPRAEAFLNSYLPALYAHIQEKGWARNYVQHVHDEPHGAEIPVYSRFARIIHKLMPGIPTVDAVGLNQQTDYLSESTDIWVPVLGSFDKKLPLIASHLQKGGQAWYYTCIEPRGRHLNRFIDYPLVKVRLLHWFNYRHDFSGFLHWGGNYWSPEPFENVEPVINDGATLLPPGDNAIVYPDPERNSVLSSVRLEVMREGIEDYELFKVLEKQDPNKAATLAGTAIPNITDYVREVPEFRKLQAQLLGQ
jgi:hypothetical protein